MSTNTPTELARRVAAELIEEAKWTKVSAERDALRAELAAGSFYKEPDIDALMAERDTLAADRYALAVAIMGGEDAPGYSTSVPAEALVELVEEMRRDRDALAAEAERLRAAADRDAPLLAAARAYGLVVAALAPKGGE